MKKENKLLNKLLFIINVILLVLNSLIISVNTYNQYNNSFKPKQETTKVLRAESVAPTTNVKVVINVPFQVLGDFDIRLRDTNSKVYFLDSANDMVHNPTYFGLTLEKPLNISTRLVWFEFFISTTTTLTKEDFLNTSSAVINGATGSIKCTGYGQAEDNGLVYSRFTCEIPTYSVNNTNNVFLTLNIGNLTHNGYIAGTYFKYSNDSLLNLDTSFDLTMSDSNRDFSYYYYNAKPNVFTMALGQDSNIKKSYITDSLSYDGGFKFQPPTNFSATLNSTNFSMSLLVKQYSISTFEFQRDNIINVSQFTKTFRGTNNEYGYDFTIDELPSLLGYINIFYIEFKTNVYAVNIQAPNYEVIDIPSIMFTILTLPFTFITGAFNFTFFAGTPYAINLADCFLAIITIILFIFIIKLIMKLKG